mmetsp:Transcript_26186/g.73256  ORF Transcript_26186/g.73256 Transcript_26186/m.73256 type:complete len:544 (-) Transcript_26186:406-2037(-)
MARSAGCPDIDVALHDCLADACLEGEADQIQEVIRNRGSFLAKQRSLRTEVEAEILHLANAKWDVDRVLGEYQERCAAISPPRLPKSAADLPPRLPGGMKSVPQSPSENGPRQPTGTPCTPGSCPSAPGGLVQSPTGEPRSPSGAPRPPAGTPTGPRPGVPQVRRFRPARSYSSRSGANSESHWSASSSFDDDALKNSYAATCSNNAQRRRTIAKRMQQNLQQRHHEVDASSIHSDGYDDSGSDCGKDHPDRSDGTTTRATTHASTASTTQNSTPIGSQRGSVESENFQSGGSSSSACGDNFPERPASATPGAKSSAYSFTFSCGEHRTSNKPARASTFHYVPPDVGASSASGAHSSSRPQPIPRGEPQPHQGGHRQPHAAPRAPQSSTFAGSAGASSGRPNCMWRDWWKEAAAAGLGHNFDARQGMGAGRPGPGMGPRAQAPPPQVHPSPPPQPPPSRSSPRSRPAVSTPASPSVSLSFEKAAMARLEARLQELRRAPKEEKRKATKEMLVQWHPDKNPGRGEEATRVFQWLQNRKKELLGL